MAMAHSLIGDYEGRTSTTGAVGVRPSATIFGGSGCKPNALVPDANEDKRAATCL